MRFHCPFCDQTFTGRSYGDCPTPKCPAGEMKPPPTPEEAAAAEAKALADLRFSEAVAAEVAKVLAAREANGK